jgi:GR25 family glycosyltransferase involved in LPS biosynthesis/GT2 family glycosyltransferase
MPTFKRFKPSHPLVVNTHKKHVTTKMSLFDTATHDSFSSTFMKLGNATTLATWIAWLRRLKAYDTAIEVAEPYRGIFTHHVTFLTELSICYFYNHRYKDAWDICHTILAIPTLTEAQVNSTWVNAHLCIPHLATTPPETHILIPPQSALGLITVTITTCKRLDLFRRTMTSFMHNCTDLHLVDRWLCVDDNSSDEDRRVMRDLYPFVEFIWKTPAEKGHAVSMNRLRQEIKTPWVWHMEDDWEFIRAAPYLSECLQVLQEDTGYGQCLVNQNYMEIASDLPTIKGGIPCTTTGGVRYLEHEHLSRDVFAAKYGEGQLQNAYWPHYSLRVGLTRRQVFETVGAFSEVSEHFELEYARRYLAKEYKTTFLRGIAAIHIGRLTSERDSGSDNAYTLNHQPQFERPPPPPPSANTRVRCLVINLDRRPDRLETFQSRVQLPCDRYAAVDGAHLVATRGIEQLFCRNDYFYRNAMIGCALSHLDVWVRLVNDTEADVYVVLEDDIEVADDFTTKCRATLDFMREQGVEWDVIMLGHHLYVPPDVRVTDAPLTIEKWDTIKSLTLSAGGTGGYMISKKGARDLLAFVQRLGMLNGIDTMIQHACDTISVYYVEPHIVFADAMTMENLETIDTDIQRDCRTLMRPDTVRLQEECAFLDSHGIPFTVYRHTSSDEFQAVLHAASVTVVYADGAEMMVAAPAGYVVHQRGSAVYTCVPESMLETYPVLGDNGLLCGGVYSTGSLIAYAS